VEVAAKLAADGIRGVLVLARPAPDGLDVLANPEGADTDA
jgi:hypothetical protein